MPKLPKHTFWAIDGWIYGRIKEYPTVEAFLTRRYNLIEDEDYALGDHWKAEHPLEAYIKETAPKVKRQYYRYGFENGGRLYLGDAKLGTRGAFEVWELED